MYNGNYSTFFFTGSKFTANEMERDRRKGRAWDNIFFFVSVQCASHEHVDSAFIYANVWSSFKHLSPVQSKPGEYNWEWLNGFDQFSKTKEFESIQFSEEIPYLAMVSIRPTKNSSITELSRNAFFSEKTSKGFFFIIQDATEPFGVVEINRSQS